jgi:hypothetical protein
MIDFPQIVIPARELADGVGRIVFVWVNLT